MEDKHEIIRAFTDGSCNRNVKPSPGGWAFVAFFNGRIIQRFGCAADSTNNEMELTAILRVLEFVRFGPQTLRIWTDSAYARSALTKWHFGWAKQGWMTGTGTPVKNADVIRAAVECLALHSQFRRVEIKWLRGHSGHWHNEHADRLAGEARRSQSANWMYPAHLAPHVSYPIAAV